MQFSRVAEPHAPHLGFAVLGTTGLGLAFHLYQLIGAGLSALPLRVLEQGSPAVVIAMAVAILSALLVSASRREQRAARFLPGNRKTDVRAGPGGKANAAFVAGLVLVPGLWSLWRAVSAVR